MENFWKRAKSELSCTSFQLRHGFPVSETDWSPLNKFIYDQRRFARENHVKGGLRLLVLNFSVLYNKQIRWSMVFAFVFYFGISDTLEYRNSHISDVLLLWNCWYNTKDQLGHCLKRVFKLMLMHFRGLWLADRKINLKALLDSCSSLNKERLLDNAQRCLENLYPNSDMGCLQLASRQSPYMDCPDSNNGHLPMPRTEKMKVSFLSYLKNEKYK